MSIVCANKTPNGYWLASDTMSGGSKVSDTGFKWIVKKSVALGCVGSLMVRQDLIKRNILKNVKTIDALIAKLTYPLQIITKPEIVDGIPTYGQQFIFVCKDGIYKIFQDLSYIKEDGFSAIGSGEEYAYGTYYLFYRVIDVDQIEPVAQLATQAAIHYDQDCGGSVIVQEFSPK